MRWVITRVRGRAMRYVSSVTLEHSVIEYYISHVRGSAPYSTPQWSQLRSITNNVAEPRPAEAVELSRNALIKFPQHFRVSQEDVTRPQTNAETDTRANLITFRKLST